MSSLLTSHEKKLIAARPARTDEAEEDDDLRSDRRDLLERILARAMDVSVRRGNESGGHTAGYLDVQFPLKFHLVFVPVPAVPVRALDEMTAVTTGQKRAIYMPGSYNVRPDPVPPSAIQI